MKFKYICTLLTLISALYFVTADAQTHKKARKTVHRKAYHPKVVKKAAPANLQKSIAKTFGNGGASVKVDTSKNGNTGGNSLSEEIVVTTAYKPILADAVKIRINPDLEDKTPYKAPLVYMPLDKRLELNSQIKQLDAMKRPPERDTMPSNNYIKIGAGSLNTTFGEAFFDNGRDQALQVGGYLKHYALHGSLPRQNSNTEQAGIFGKSIGNVNTLSGRIDYSYRGNRFYGYDQYSTVYPSNLMTDKQHFSTISAEGEIAKNYKDVDNAFTYALKLKGYMFSDAYQAKESNIVLTGFLNETVGHFYAGVSSSLDLSTQQDSLYNMNNSIIRANPYLKFQGESYKIDAGINVVDQFGSSSAFNIFPAAKLEFQVIPKYVRLFVEAKGDVNKTSLLGFSLINPYLGQNMPIKNSVDQLDIAAGLKGTLAPGIGFKVTVFRNQVKNMPLFVSNFDFSKGYNRFKVIYDEGKSKVSGLNGELDFKATESLDIFGRVELRQYNMATVAHPWNLPQFKANVGAVIHITNKVNLTGTMVVRGSALDPYLTQVGNQTPQPTTINSYVDISGELEYKATRKLSVFVHVNNLLSGANQTWLFYPEYGFNVFGGVGYRF